MTTINSAMQKMNEEIVNAITAIPKTYAVSRWNKDQQKNVVTTQVSIDGYRLIAEKTGRYSPGKESTYTYDENENLISATAYVKKMTSDGTWHEVAATAFYVEYMQKNKAGELTKFWANMPHIMLAKCAESLALRKAFPGELSGIYTHDEMSQATLDKEQEEDVKKQMAPEKLSNQQIAILDSYLNDDDTLEDKIKKQKNIKSVYDLKPNEFDGLIKWLSNKKEKINESARMA